MGENRQRKTMLYLLFVFLLLLAVIYVYMVHPISRKITITENNLANQQMIYTSLKAKASQIAQIPDADRIKLAVIRRQVPELPYVDSILRDLRRLEVISKAQMKQYNITLGTASVQGQDQGSSDSAVEGEAQAASGPTIGNVVPIKIETSFAGTYEQINRLFTELEGLDRLIQVDKMTFSVKQEPLVQVNNPQELISSNLTLIAYYSPTLQSLLKQPYSIDYTNPKGRINPFN